MSIYSKISGKRDRLRSRLRELSTSLTSRQAIVVNITDIEKNLYYDIISRTITSVSYPVTVKFPQNQFPTQLGADNSVYLFDILPIKILAGDSVPLKKDDRIMVMLYNSTKRLIKSFLLVITEEVIDIEYNLTHSTFNAAPFNDTSMDGEFRDGYITPFNQGKFLLTSPSVELNTINNFFLSSYEIGIGEIAVTGGRSLVTVDYEVTDDDAEILETATININSDDKMVRLYRLGDDFSSTINTTP